MPNIFDYLNWRGDLTIEKDGFNDVDAVILSRLSYLPFDNIVKESLDETITIKEAANLYFSCEQNSGRELWKGDYASIVVSAPFSYLTKGRNASSAKEELDKIRDAEYGNV
ncbi:MAG: hypothetical protein U0L58_06315, partial [Ruminococcus sp.]|nr:hypothetical protein [Ruminococcus sp.]